MILFPFKLNYIKYVSSKRWLLLRIPPNLLQNFSSTFDRITCIHLYIAYKQGTTFSILPVLCAGFPTGGGALLPRARPPVGLAAEGVARPALRPGSTALEAAAPAPHPFGGDAVVAADDEPLLPAPAVRRAG